MFSMLTNPKPTADDIADVLEGAATGSPSDLARVQYAVSGYLAPSYSSAKIPCFATVCYEGDSRTAQTSDLSNATWPKMQPFGVPTWAEAYLKTKFRILNNGAVPGCTTTDLKNRIATTVWAYQPMLMFYFIDVNDIATGVSEKTVLANHTYCITETLKRGIQVVVFLSSLYDGAGPAKLAQSRAYNRRLRNLCNTVGAYVCDVFSAVCDPSTGNMLAGMSTDGTHLNIKGAQTGGKKVSDDLAGKFALIEFPMYATDKYASDATSKNWHNNSLMLGANGARDTVNTTGIVADNWTLQSVAAVQVAASKLGTDLDAGCGDAQRLVATATGPGQVTLYSATGITSMDTAKKVFAAAMMQLSAVSGALTGLALHVYTAGAAAARSSTWGYKVTDHGNLIATPAAFAASTQPFDLTVAAGSSVYIEIQLQFNGPGSATLDVGPVLLSQTPY